MRQRNTRRWLESTVTAVMELHLSSMPHCKQHEQDAGIAVVQDIPGCSSVRLVGRGPSLTSGQERHEHGVACRLGPKGNLRLQRVPARWDRWDVHGHGGMRTSVF